MDPLSILSIVGTSLSIAKVTITSIQHLYELKEKYSYVDLSVSGLLFKLQTITYSLATLERWAQDRGGTQHSNHDLVVQLEISIQSCTSVISCIDLKVKDASGKASVWEKIKHVWNEEVICGFERDLDSQMNALQLLISTAQLLVH
jgi:hypothetical protein